VQIVVHKSKAFAFEKLADLRGKVLGGVLGATYGEAVDNAVKEGVFRLDRHSSQAVQLRAVLAGRLDGALVGNGMPGFESVLASSPELLAQRADLQVLAPPLISKALHLAAAKVMDRKGAIERFNKGLREVQKAESAKSTSAEAAPRK
jgi:ABC-type amino acid transport substrate-binding protein